MASHNITLLRHDMIMLCHDMIMLRPDITMLRPDLTMVGRAVTMANHDRMLLGSAMAMQGDNALEPDLGMVANMPRRGTRTCPVRALVHGPSATSGPFVVGMAGRWLGAQP